MVVTGASFAFKVCLCPVGRSQLLMCSGQHRALIQDERCGFLKVPIIQKVINMLWFANKNNEGIKHHTCFKPFPLPALASVLTAVSVVLHARDSLTLHLRLSAA